MHTNYLECFSAQARKFQNHEQFFQNLTVGLEINGEIKQGKTTFTGMGEESFISVLVHFRPFYMKDSELNFKKVAEHILQNQSYVEYHPCVNDFLRIWDKLLDSKRKNVGGMSITIGNNPISVKKNFDIWINEAYLHAEQYKPESGKGLDQIKSHPIFENFSKFNMIDLLQRLTTLIIAFNIQVVGKLLLEEKS
ncbi:MAG: hypothetical protein Q8P20_05475 [bacterium]|nr:hypothetical protein [bacterium]